MAKRTEQQWRELLQQHDDSGLTAAEFCRNNKLCPKYFSLRRKQLSCDKTDLAVSAPQFIAAKLPTKKATDKNLITLKYQSCQLQMPVSVSEQWLAGLLKTLC